MIESRGRTEYQNKIAKLIEGREWLERHLQEVQSKYGGKWVGISGDSVVAFGDTAEEVREKVAEGSLIDLLIMRVPIGEISKPI